MKDVKILTITPEIACEMLEQNSDNRTISQATVDAYARDLKNGDFKFNGDSIRMREDGILADGQHRLWACVQTGIPFQSVLFTGLTKEDVKTIDRNKVRSSGDVLRISRGYKNGDNLASAIRFVGHFATGERNIRLTDHEIIHFIDNCPEIEESNKICGMSFARAGALKTRSGVFVAIHFIGWKVFGEKDMADDFMRVLQTGVPIYENDAAHKLRDVLLKDNMSTKKLRVEAKTAYVAAAWRKFQSATPVKVLRPLFPYRIKEIPFKDFIKG